MKTPHVLAIVAALAGVAVADPLVVNNDGTRYQLELECKHLSASRSIGADGGIERMEGYKVGANCKIHVYPYDNPYDKDGNYDPKKRHSSSKVKKDSECTITKGKLACE